MDMNAMLRQAQAMQRQMSKKQKEVEEKEFNVSSAGGAIDIVIKGNKQILSVNVDEDLLNKEDKEMFQDMLVVAFNEAIKKVEDEMSKAMSSMTGGMNIPGLF